METIDSVWQISLIALIAGVLIGALVYRQFTASNRETEQARNALEQTRKELDAARQELEEYKTSVNQHFDKASDLVRDLTQDYVKVYQHLAEGAQTLGDSKNFNQLLEQQPGKVSIALEEKPAVVEEAPEAAEPSAGDNADTDDEAETPPSTATPPSADSEEIDEHAAPYVDAPAGDKTVAEESDPAQPQAEASSTGQDESRSEFADDASQDKVEATADAADTDAQTSETAEKTDAGTADADRDVSGEKQKTA